MAHYLIIAARGYDLARVHRYRYISGVSMIDQVL